ncbi:hypothetical protein [Candidatus Poriferisodalis sp.]|uniref:hypothetical protein n=1 Tax=Candidatus Poriferisodalis sp. TaxID=3101277 RepID=UPI003B02914E
MQPVQQALIGAAHLETAVLDAIGGDTLTALRVRQRLFPSNEDGSADLVAGALWHLETSGQLDVEQAVERQHYRYRRL